MLPHQRSWRCQPSASLPSAPPTGSCSWGSVPQWLHLSLQITFKKLSLDSMPQAEMAGYPSKLQLGDKDPPHPWPLQSPSRFRHPGLEQPNAYLLLVRVRQEAAAFLQGSQDLLLCAVFLQVAVQIAHQPLAHLTEATVLQRCHTRCVRKRAQAQRRPGPLSPRGGWGAWHWPPPPPGSPVNTGSPWVEQRWSMLHTNSGLASCRRSDRMELPYVSTNSWHSSDMDVGNLEHTLSRA